MHTHTHTHVYLPLALPCPPHTHTHTPPFKQMLEKKPYPSDLLPFSGPGADNKREIKPNGGRFSAD